MYSFLRLVVKAKFHSMIYHMPGFPFQKEVGPIVLEVVDHH